MLERFKKYIAGGKLINQSDKILLGISGGVDSVVMGDLFYRSRIKFGIVHCNYQLRGKDSDEDEKFVKQLAKRYKVPFYSKKINTSAYAKAGGISIQMAARELRFGYFEEIRYDSGFETIAVATHINDAIETFFINVTRGTGLSGMHGILPKRDKVIRPLLFATRKEILEYAIKFRLDWREDKSNLADDYIRNKIRHHVIPVLKEINPALEPTFFENFRRITETEEIYKNHIAEMSKSLVVNKGEGYEIPLAKLERLSPLRTYLYEFLKPFGFNETVTEELSQGIQKQPGKKYLSASHEAFIDRKSLMIRERNKGKKQNDYNESIINKYTEKTQLPVPLKFRLVDKKNFTLVKDEKTACLDFGSLQFPLLLRPWKEGDAFVPLGMKGRKKLSDFLIDKKIPLAEKNNIFVLTSMGKIVWVAGIRIGEHYKVRKQTKKVFIAELVDI